MNEKVKAFDQVADAYDDWYKHPQGKQVFKAERDAVNQTLPAKGLGLEIGSGTGAFVKGLETINRVIIGLDPSINMISKAKQKGVYSVLGYGDYAPFRKVFDFSYMVTVIEFLKDPVSTLKCIKRICKENAPFTLLFINSESSWGDLYKDIGSKGDKVFSQARLYNLDEITELIEKNDYRVTQVKGTLSSSPMSSEVDGRLVNASKETGVIIVKSIIG